jgi:dihydroorotase
MGELAEAGAVAFSDDGNTVMNSRSFRRALEYSKIFGRPLILHEEDRNLSADGQVNEGFYSTLLGLKGIPAAAEEVLIARDLILARLTGAQVHFAHISTKGSVALIRQAKQDGLRVTCEVTPHHLVLTQEALTGFDTSLKVNPPLRSKDDIEALREGLKDGTIDAIASDHAPHALHEKEQEFDKAPFGMVGLETSLALLLTELVEKEVIDYADLVEKMSLNPAQILDLPMGTLATGAEANLTVVDPGLEFVVDAALFESKSRNTPFSGWSLKGKATDVFVSGRLVMKGGRIV